MDSVDLPPNFRTEKQVELYNNLKEINGEAASFYFDALQILEDGSLQARTNIIAHLAREIDSSLRDMLVSESDKKITLSKEEIEKLKNKINSELKIKGVSEINQLTKHVASVCTALGIDKKSDLLEAWIVVAAQFVKFAHHHGPTERPRSLELFRDVWDRYENVLFRLVGTYYNTLDNILDRILKMVVPTDDIINTLPGLFQTSANKHYFFTKLDKIGWLKPLKDAGFFNPEKNPKLEKSLDGKSYHVPYWSVLNYIERITKKGLKDKEWELVIDIIKKIMEYREDGKRINNPNTDYQVFKIICNLPSVKITSEHVNFIAHTLDSEFRTSPIASDIGTVLIPKLVTDGHKELLLQLLEIIARFRFEEINNIEIITSRMEEYWLANAIRKNSQALCSCCGSGIIKLLVDRIHEINKVDTYTFSNAYLPTIEDHEQISSPDKFEVVIVRLLRDALLELNTSQSKPIVEKFLKDDTSIILKRIGFFIINQKYTEFKEIFWSVDYNPLEEWQCRHELYELMKTHAKEFNTEEIDLLTKWIENKKYPVREEAKQDKDVLEQDLAYWKKEWYSALLSSENSIVVAKYNDYDKRNPQEIEHPGFISWHSTMSGGLSPLQENELSQMSNESIAEYLTNFNEKSVIPHPFELGLAETLTKNVKSNPSKFSEELDVYKNIPMAYRYALLDSFRQAWNDKKEINWENIMNYITHTVASETKTGEGGTRFDYYAWFTSQACMLVNEGVQSDDHAFDVKFLPIAKEILFQINNKIVVKKCESVDYITFTLNSVKGHLLEAMLNYSLRQARVKKSAIWDKDIQDLFDTELKKTPSVELHTLLGLSIRNFLYLNKEWFIKNISLIFPKDNQELSQAALSGYLYNQTVYRDIYEMLKTGGIYSTALQNWNQNTNHVKEKLVAHFCLAYAEGWETLEDKNSLISLLLNEKDSHVEIIRFFMFKLNRKNEYLPKMKILWKLLYGLNKTEKTVLGKLANWLGLFESLDNELFEWSMECAKYVGQYSETTQFIKALTKFVEAEPKKVGDIFWSLIEGSKTVLPDYKRQDIIFIVDTLYSKNEKELADKICNRYGKLGNHILREVYRANQ